MNELHNRVSAVNAALEEIEDLDIEAIVITRNGWVAATNQGSFEVAEDLLHRAGKNFTETNNT